jgi:hypothetical protein
MNLYDYRSKESHELIHLPVMLVRASSWGLQQGNLLYRLQMLSFGILSFLVGRGQRFAKSSDVF